ncbi:hypothetical protein [Rathayibacter sp. Leaf296]|uniref:hypothetical protein n=1 Tax=Rathayibacter sp. Leaf296 TaxID=1736327 RepID=UPI0012FA739E|nr:hypothetical protein [Rathayibacter sp. Leaf296]
MSRRVWWTVLIAYTALLWAVVLGFSAALTAMPEAWSYSGGEPPIEMIVSTLGYNLGPAAATAALALTVTSIAAALARTRRRALKSDDSVDPGSDEAVAIDRLPAS